MPVNETLLAEFDQEMGNTRKTLERVPEDKLTWKPHEKSGTMAWLAGHVANIPGWLAEVINKNSLDLAPGGVPAAAPPPPKSSKEILEMFDQGVSAGRAALAGASDTHLAKPWSLLTNGQAILTLPRSALIRTFVLNHLIHHRAQLGVYLRLNNVPVPALYGPSADEGSM